MLYYLSDEYSKELGSFFYSRNYKRKMNNSEMSINRKILKFFLNPLYGKKINYKNVSKDELLSFFINNKKFNNDKSYKSLDYKVLDHDKEKEDLLFTLKRDIEHWKNISKIPKVENNILNLKLKNPKQFVGYTKKSNHLSSLLLKKSCLSNGCIN